MEYKIIQNPRNKRWTIFRIDPTKRGKFGYYKIMAGGFKTREDAERKLPEDGESSKMWWQK